MPAARFFLPFSTPWHNISGFHAFFFMKEH